MKTQVKENRITAQSGRKPFHLRGAESISAAFYGRQQVQTRAKGSITVKAVFTEPWILIDGDSQRCKFEWEKVSSVFFLVFFFQKAQITAFIQSPAWSAGQPSWHRCRAFFSLSHVFT